MCLLVFVRNNYCNYYSHISTALILKNLIGRGRLSQIIVTSILYVNIFASPLKWGMRNPGKKVVRLRSEHQPRSNQQLVRFHRQQSLRSQVHFIRSRNQRTIFLICIYLYGIRYYISLLVVW